MQSLASLLIFGLGILAILRFGFTVTTVHGSSMSPTLKEGDRLLTFKLLPTVWLQNGQIVIADLSQIELPPAEIPYTALEAWDEPNLGTNEGTEPFAGLDEPEAALDEPVQHKIVKRVIGLPGDTVVIPLASLSTDMQALLRTRCDVNGNLVWTVPRNHCFLRGDGSFSIDSLLLECIPLSTITGIMLLKLPPRSLVPSTLPITQSLS